MRYRTVLCAALLACGVTSSSSSDAQPTQAEIEASKKVAADAANKAVDAFRDGKYEDAIAGFQKADKAFHALKFVLYIARAQAKLGKLVAARATYEAIVKEQLPAYAPPEFFTAQADAKKELVDLIARIPTIQLQVKAGVTGATLDGATVAAGQAIPVDPGEHTIAAIGPDQRPFSRKVTVQERDAKVEALEPPGASSTVPPTATTPAATTSATAPASTAGPGASQAPTATAPAATGAGGSFLGGMPTATKVSYGIGAAGLVLGAVFGGLTLAKKGDYDALRGATPLDATAVNDAASQGRTFAIVTDVGFLAAIAGAAAGTIVWIVAPRAPAPAADHGATGAARTLAVGARANGLTVGGTF